MNNQMFCPIIFIINIFLSLVKPTFIMTHKKSRLNSFVNNKSFTNNSAKEYKDLFKLGFISLEEVDANEADHLLETLPSINSIKKDGLEQRNPEKVSLANKESKPKKKTKKNKSSINAKDVTGIKDIVVEAAESSPPVIPSDYSLILPGWKDFLFSFHPSINYALYQLNFNVPTDVQLATLREHFKNPRKDLLGSAPTGSGKTLAYLLPILNTILNERNHVEETEGNLEMKKAFEQNSVIKPVNALIIVPTRELALQIRDHLDSFTQHILAFLKFTNTTDTNYRQLLSSICLVGGLSQEKQERQLSHQPSIIIATPGRLAELLFSDESESNSNNGLKDRIGMLRFLVIDEADRMAEKGHFKDMKEIYELINMSQRRITGEKSLRKRQTFLFSATLLRHTLTDNWLEKLRRQFHFYDRKPIIINCCGKITEKDAGFDVSKSIDSVNIANIPHTDYSTRTSLSSLPSTIESYRVDCPIEDKTLMLLAILQDAPCRLYLFPSTTNNKVNNPTTMALRILVFVNTIEAVRQVTSILSHLLIPTKLAHYVGSLHAQLQQRQRIKNLERFKVDSLPHYNGKQYSLAVLVTTDVAARGLDIPSVSMVIHYHLPNVNYNEKKRRHNTKEHTVINIDTFLHRSGRTGRAGNRGVNISIISPSELSFVSNLTSFRLQEYPSLGALLTLTDEQHWREPFKLATKLVKLKVTSGKESREDTWEKEAAEVLGLDYDDWKREQLGKTGKGKMLKRGFKDIEENYDNKSISGNEEMKKLETLLNQLVFNLHKHI